MMTHEYLMVLYGVLLWQAEQAIVNPMPLRNRAKLVGRSMIWGGLVVIFDDEIVHMVGHFTGYVAVLEWYYYVVAGFFIDVVRSRVVQDGKQRWLK